MANFHMPERTQPRQRKVTLALSKPINDLLIPGDGCCNEHWSGLRRPVSSVSHHNKPLSVIWPGAANTQTVPRTSSVVRGVSIHSDTSTREDVCMMCSSGCTLLGVQPWTHDPWWCLNIMVQIRVRLDLWVEQLNRGQSVVRCIKMYCIMIVLQSNIEKY